MKNHNTSIHRDRMRSLARGTLRGENPDVENLSPEDLRVLVHEFGVYQVELETQNEELRETRQLLEEARDCYRELYDFAPVGYLTLDVMGVIREANVEGSRMLDMKRAHLLGRELADLLARESAGILRRMLLEKQTRNLEVRIGAATDERHLRLNIALDAKESGIEYRTALIDVTDARRAEKSLRQSEARFRSLTETAPLGIFEADRSGRFTYINRQWEVITGISAKQSYGFGWSSAIHPEERRRIREEWSGRIGEGPWRQEFRLNRPDGSEGWGRMLSSPTGMRNGRPTGYVGTLEDITDRMEAIRESENRYRALVTASSEIIYRMSPDWSEMRQLNSSGFLAPTDKPNRNWLQDYIHPDDQQYVKTVIQDAIQTKSIFEMEYRVLREDRSLGWTFSRAIPLIDAKGEITEWFGTASDITERRRAEEEIKNAGILAEEASRAKSEFLANMSHEIRTPMTVTMGVLEILADSNLEDHQRQLVQMASGASEALLRLINDILDFSKIEAGKTELHLEVCSLRHCLDSAMEFFALEAKKKDLRISAEISSEIPEILYCDGDKIKQVMLNLLSNAIKFTEKGGITLKAEPADGENLRISLRDTGIGMPREKMDELFQSFSQLDASRTRKYGGSGLGLAISKGLVELMGGEIHAESHPGDGSVFSFTIPLHRVEGLRNPSGKTPPAGEESKSLSARILVAEDDPQIRKLLEVILVRWGGEVVTVRDGEEAVKAWQESGCDLILMDLQMPRMDGLEATGLIRQKEGDEGRIPIIALTAHARKDDETLCREAGMDGWVTKPIDSNLLYSVLRKYVGSSGG